MLHERKRVTLAVATAAGVLLAMAAAVPSAAATPGTAVAFVVNNQFGGLETTVTSSIPGCPAAGVTDTSDQLAFRGSTIHFSGQKLFDCGTSGTFTLAYQVLHVKCTPTNNGTWTIVGGTGAYAGMTGQGQVSGTYYPIPCDESGGVIDSYTGKLSLAGG